MSDAPPAPIITETGPSPIGVPQGYTQPGWYNPDGQIRYHDGDQFMGANQSPAEIANLQRSLAQAGLLDAFHMGVWDDPTAAAFEQVLAYANQTGLPWERALRQMLQGDITTVDENGNLISGAGGGAGGGGQLQIRVSDPATLRATFKQTAAAMRGQALSDQQIENMVAAYQAVERRSQEHAYAASEAAGATGRFEIVDPPDPQTWAEEEVRRIDPSGVMTRDTLDRMDQFFALINQGSPVQA